MIYFAYLFWFGWGGKEKFKSFFYYKGVPLFNDLFCLPLLVWLGRQRKI